MKRTEKACIKCGKSFYGGTDKMYCDECAKSIKSNVLRTRTCKMCGAEFLGGPRAFYCPDCRKIRQKEASARCKKRGASRPIGSIDKCEWCGSEYTVIAGRQKYCSDECQREAVLAWQREHKKGYNKASGQDVKKAERRKEKMKVCVYCGREFSSHTSTNACSDYCRKKNKQIKEYRSEIKRGKNANIDKLLDERKEYRLKVKKLVTLHITQQLTQNLTLIALILISYSISII